MVERSIFLLGHILYRIFVYAQRFNRYGSEFLSDKPEKELGKVSIFVSISIFISSTTTLKAHDTAPPFYLTNYSKCLLLYYIIKYCVIYAKKYYLENEPKLKWYPNLLQRMLYFAFGP